MLLVLILSIWKVRNDFLWNRIEAASLDTLVKAQTWLAEYKKWNEASLTTPSDRIHKWLPPIFGWIKCNFDASWDEQRSIGGCGMVVRNSEGHFLAVQVCREEGVGSALHAEAVAVFLCK